MLRDRIDTQSYIVYDSIYITLLNKTKIETKNSGTEKKDQLLSGARKGERG